MRIFTECVGFGRAEESIATKFAVGPPEQSQLVSTLNSIYNGLAKKGISNLLTAFKDVILEVSKTCKTQEEFVYWCLELVNINVEIWKAGSRQVISTYNNLAGYKQAKEMAADKFVHTPVEQEAISAEIDRFRDRVAQKGVDAVSLLKDVAVEVTQTAQNLSEFTHWLELLVNLEDAVWKGGSSQVSVAYADIRVYEQLREEMFQKFGADENAHCRVHV